MGVEGIIDKSIGMVDVKSDVMASKPSIVPTTPDGKRKIECASPLTLVTSDSSPSNSSDSPIGDGSETPKDCVFDPFAPGPDKFMLAPLRKRSSEESKAKASRRLNFPCGVNLITELDAELSSGTAMDEYQFVEFMYSSILDVIISEQAKEFAEEIPAPVFDLDGFGTPESAPRLSWVAETCPGAPMKSSNKFKIIDKELCRKLEF